MRACPIDVFGSLAAKGTRKMAKLGLGWANCLLILKATLKRKIQAMHPVNAQVRSFPAQLQTQTVAPDVGFPGRTAKG